MAVDTVRARRVAGSMVVTLTTKILETLRVDEGDEMQIETIGTEAVIVRKASALQASTKRLRLEFEVLEKERNLRAKESEFKQMYYVGPSGGYDDQLIAWQGADVNLAKAELAIAQKHLELFDLTGEVDVSAALSKLEAM